MNTKKFSDALGNVDESYIDEAISYKSKRKNNFWLKFGSVAACLAVVLTAGITLPALFGEDGPTPPTPPTPKIATRDSANWQIASFPSKSSVREKRKLLFTLSSIKIRLLRLLL